MVGDMDRVFKVVVKGNEGALRGWVLTRPLEGWWTKWGAGLGRGQGVVVKTGEYKKALAFRVITPAMPPG